MWPRSKAIATAIRVSSSLIQYDYDVFTLDIIRQSITRLEASPSQREIF